MLQGVAKRARKPSAFAPAVGVKQPSSLPLNPSTTNSTTKPTTTSTSVINSNTTSSPLKAALVHFTSGGMAAGLVRASLQPLDTCKTRLQASSSTATSPAALRSILFPAGAGGARGLYRGVVPGIVGIVPAAAVYMLTFQTLKAKLCAKYPRRSKDIVIVASAALGDILASLVRVPCEVLKQRLQIGIYDNVAHAVRTVMAKKQLPRLYTGLSAQLLRDVPYAAVEFVVYENVKATYAARVKRQLHKGDSLFIGAAAGACAAVVSNPMDVVKTRLMTQIKSQATAKATGVVRVARSPYTGIVNCFARVCKEEGVKTMARGLAPRIAAKSLQSALFFVAYEALRKAVGKALQVDPAVTARPVH